MLQPIDYIKDIEAFDLGMGKGAKRPENIIESNPNKIFGIGMPRTGTSSLHDAFKILNIKSFHFPQQLLHFLNYEAAVDVSTAFCYKTLDVFFPDAKFIYTKRNIDSWLKSMFNYYQKVVNIQTNPFNDKINKILFNKTKFYDTDYDDFKKGYEKHHFDVLSYFKDRPNDFLLIDIIEGDGWEKLCKFLNCDIPDVAFPNTNSLKDIDKVAESLKMDKPNIVDGELIINELS